MSKKSEYKQKNEAYLIAKKQEEEVKELAKGILYEIQKSGNTQGRRPDLRSVVCVHSTGRLINGRVFDDSRRDGIPAAFRLFEVIEGWQIALSQMRPGDRWTIYLPANMAYGSRTDGDIPGNSTLIFDVELLSIA
ncbi:MAG: FKBP-type peptidyl-prolyl cis-trans isomerase [Prevotella sp.]|nr:FKBP-type peptidyl-prolyl cis-trans isomerase [Prevotella sp.]MDY5665693.1 FKBP-type peptidyl-prolyl cis-trans isomerase [Alloprevotella sp.]